MKSLLIAVALAGPLLSSCSGLQQFTDADRLNAIAISKAAGDQTAVRCGQELAPVTMPTPDPTADGVLTLAARKFALQSAVRDACGGILATELAGRVGL